MSNGTLPTAVLMKVERGKHATSGKYFEFFQSVKKAEAEAEQAAAGALPF
jgi:hypothetical protein